MKKVNDPETSICMYLVMVRLMFLHSMAMYLRIIPTADTVLCIRVSFNMSLMAGTPRPSSDT